MNYSSTSNDSNRLMFGTPGIVISGTLMLAMAILSFCFTENTPFFENFGICLPSPNLWNINPTAGFIANIFVISLCGLAMIWLNKNFNIVAGHSILFSSAFFLITGSNPWLTNGLDSASIFALTMIVAIHLLFKTYGTRNATSELFLLFSTLAFGSMIQYAFALMIPIFLIGAMYMNVFRLREIIAAALGIVAPYWILIGFGVVSINDIVFPSLSNIFANTAPSFSVLLVLISVGFTFLTALLLAFFNAQKVFASSAKIRAYNSFINLLGITLAWYMVFDHTNLITYAMALNLIAGLQIAHFFGRNRINYGYAYYMTGIAIYISLFILICNA